MKLVGTGARSASLVAIAVALQGCTVFSQLGLYAPRGSGTNTELANAIPALASEPRPAMAPVPESAPNTAAGRLALANGEDAKAASYFHEALANGENTAVAANGLGVAFARQERTDLAIQYFLVALQSDPANARYLGNLDRARLAQAQPVLPSAPLFADAPPVSPAKVEQVAAGQLERVGRRAFVIRTAPGAAPAPAPAAAGSRLALVESRFKPLVRIDLATDAKLASSAPAANATPASRGKSKMVQGFVPLVRLDLGQMPATGTLSAK